MNYLAHCYLSGNSEELLIGNFIADSIKGKDFYNYSEPIIKGIRLHRAIDEFTDKHPIVKESKKRASKDVGRYAPVIIDIYYDHFLAMDWKEYSSQDLKSYTIKVYKILSDNFQILPDQLKVILPHMISSNWLLNYGNIDGITKTLQGMSRRASFGPPAGFVISTLKEGYNEYRQDFHNFFKELINFVEVRRDVL